MLAKRKRELLPLFVVQTHLSQASVWANIAEKTTQPAIAAVKIAQGFLYEGSIENERLIIQDIILSRRNRPIYVGQFQEQAPVNKLIFYSDYLARKQQGSRELLQGGYGFSGLLLLLGLVLLLVPKTDLGLVLLLSLSGVLGIAITWWLSKKPKPKTDDYLQRFAAELANLIEGEYAFIPPGIN